MTPDFERGRAAERAAVVEFLARVAPMHADWIRSGLHLQDDVGRVPAHATDEAERANIAALARMHDDEDR